ncbi:MAG: AAA family ATPase [Gallionellaceae bacterium]
MASKTTKPSRSAKTSAVKKQQPSRPTLGAISVAGYKSLVNKQRIEIRPLTILAGANSGGKSSIMQPLLLLKQTLEAPYDPGSLLLGGPNVRLTSAAQLLSKMSGSQAATEFSVEFEIGNRKVELCFRYVDNKGLEILSCTVSDDGEVSVITADADLSALKKNLNKHFSFISDEMYENGTVEIVRERSFLNAVFMTEGSGIRIPLLNSGGWLAEIITKLIHVPGLRGNPERDYRTTAVGDSFPGTFEVYVASVIKHWQSNDDDKLAQLGADLESLGLTWKVEAKQRDETQVELKVARLPHSSGDVQDLVSIADVGFGVSQTLPVLVALLTAQPGQLVYIEQPEIHLHPSAQRAFAKVLAAAAKRGVIVIIETHSALLLQGVQTLVAQDGLAPELVKLHWFQRDDTGVTTVSSADLDDTGAFGDWPEDFDDVALDSDNEYLTAAEAKLFAKNKQP